jgi:hypothetical protein
MIGVVRWFTMGFPGSTDSSRSSGHPLKPRTLYGTGLVVLVAIGTAGILAYSTIWQLARVSVLPCLSCLLGSFLALAALIVWLRTRTVESPGPNRIAKGLLPAGVFFLLQSTYFPVARGATHGLRFYVPDGFIGVQYEYCCGADGVRTVTD